MFHLGLSFPHFSCYLLSLQCCFIRVPYPVQSFSVLKFLFIFTSVCLSFTCSLDFILLQPLLYAFY